MTMRTLFAALVLLTLSLNAHGQIWEGPLEIRLSPDVPDSSSRIEAIVPIHGCYQSGPYYYSERTQVTREGRTITIELHGPGLIFCAAAGDFLATWRVPIPLGTLDTGTYSLTVKHDGMWVTHFPSLPQLTRTFSVAAAPVPVPANHSGLVTALIVLLLALGCWRLRIRWRNPATHGLR